MRSGKHRHRRRRVGAYRHESSVTERKLAGMAIDEIETDGQRDIDPDARQHIDEVGINLILDESQNDAHRERHQQEQSWTREKHQTFSACNLPSKPAGRNKRMRISRTKAIASVQVDQRLPLTKVSMTPI